MTTKLFLATPMYNGTCTAIFVQSLIELNNHCFRNNIEFKFVSITTESLITRARTKLVDMFLQTDYTHLLFMDADQSFSADQIQQLIDYDQPVVAAIVPKKLLNWARIKELIAANPQLDEAAINKLQIEACVNTLDNDQYNRAKKVSGLIPVRHAGTGCMLIKRRVFLQLEPIMPKYKDYGSSGNTEPQTRTLWFDTGIEESRGLYLSEDYWFCDKWNKIGTTYVAPHIQLKHQGNYVYG